LRSVYPILRIPLLSLLGLALWPAAAFAAANPPALPAKMVSPLPSDGPGGRIITIRPSDNLQAALNAAQPGDTLVLQAGGTWTGNFQLPRRPDSGWVTIRGSAQASLPPSGHRVTPANAAAMPKLLTPNSSPALSAADGTHGWRIVGIEIAVVPTWPTGVYQLVLFGWGSGPFGRRTASDVVASRFIVERCYIHGSPAQKVRRGILANALDVRIADSWIDEIHDSGFDSQAILAYDGPGPFLIENNELQASSENIMFGGADSSGPQMLASDITIRRNHIIKPLTWKSDDPSYLGRAWVIKPLIELKAAQRVLIEGNILENSWLWPAFVTDAFTQENREPWLVVQDVTFQNNVIKNSMGVYQAWSAPAPVRRIKIFNNNATGIRYRIYKPIGPSYATGTFFYIINAQDVWIEHNTGQPLDRGTGSIETGTNNSRLTIKNNVFGYGHGGFMVTSWTNAEAAIAAAAPGNEIARNALVNLGDAVGTPAIPYQQTSWNRAGWILTGNANASGLNPDGTLSGGPLKGSATDGKDLGVDFRQLEVALGAAVSSLPGPATPGSPSTSIPRASSSAATTSPASSTKSTTTTSSAGFTRAAAPMSSAVPVKSNAPAPSPASPGSRSRISVD
jgi:hypothetical protein